MDDMIHVITMIHGDTCDHRVYQVHGDIHGDHMYHHDTW